MVVEQGQTGTREIESTEHIFSLCLQASIFDGERGLRKKQEPLLTHVNMPLERNEEQPKEMRWPSRLPTPTGQRAGEQRYARVAAFHVREEYGHSFSSSLQTAYNTPLVVPSNPELCKNRERGRETENSRNIVPASLRGPHKNTPLCEGD